MSLNTVYDVILTHLPHNRRTSGGWHSFNAPCCHHRGHRREREKRGGILFDGFAVVYNCFNCQYRTGWAPGSRLTKKMTDLLTWMGVSGDLLKELSFAAAKYRHDLAMGGARVLLPDGLKNMMDLFNEDCGHPKFLKIAEFLLEGDPPQDLTQYYWTPDDNGFGASDYAITINGTEEWPTSWGGVCVLKRGQPIWTHRGPDNAMNADDEITDAEWNAMKAEFEAAFPETC